MAENYELAYIDYKNGMKYKEIAEKYGVTLNTVKSWKTRKWNDLEDEKGVHTKQKSVHTKKSDAKPKEKVIESEEITQNKNGDLTDKQWLFCVYFTKYWNATKAYQKAYNCTYLSAKAHGYKLLQTVAVKNEIDRMKKELEEETFVESRAVLQKYIDIAFADIGDYVKIDKFSVVVRDMENVDTSLIVETAPTEFGVKIKMADKMKALDFLAKYTDLLNERELKRLQVEKLKTETELAKIAIRKESGEEEDEHEDDGFFEALGTTAAEVWSEEDD